MNINQNNAPSKSDVRIVIDRSPREEAGMLNTKTRLHGGVRQLKDL